MKSIIALLAIVAYAHAASQVVYEQIPILRNDVSIHNDGSYEYAYETGNGIAAEEEGVLKAYGTESTINAKGQFRYTSPGGEKQHIGYIADENGFQPFSETGSIPTGPAIPPLIARALKWIAEQEYLRSQKKISK